MLQNAVNSGEEACAVKTQADQFKTQEGTDITLFEYKQLLISATLALKKTLKSRWGSVHRSAQVHNFIEENLQEYDHLSDHVYDIDSDASHLGSQDGTKKFRACRGP